MAEDDGFSSLGEERQESEPPYYWLISLADMSMLLMSFFILLFSMSNIDAGKFQDSFGAVQKALGGAGLSEGAGGVTAKELSSLVDAAKLKQRLVAEQRRVFDDFHAYASTRGIEGLASARLESGKITIAFPVDVLFPKDGVELTDQGRSVLKTMYEFLIKAAGERINIRGFTDNEPPGPGSRFKDNWEISSLRAVNVLRYLVALGMSPNRLTATGLADLEPLIPNTTPENRAKNQRVELVLERWIGE